MSSDCDGFAVYLHGPAETCIAMMRDMKAGGRLKGTIAVNRSMDLDRARVSAAPDRDDAPCDGDPPPAFHEADQALLAEAMELPRHHGLT
ncbi:hypothetical protein ENKNEFLB_03583 [Nocardioides aquaticus]|uniref:Uncharacterized protein n=2 Tax=Actinomycetes TaxID=1760 RepID=A0ABP4DZH6_9ACTN|nr:hypothetical protein [Nocardioides aquaticus]QVT81175.1 hypothetical protein ENKNEFLB_03583 [Nocardioides aquaticus]